MAPVPKKKATRGRAGRRRRDIKLVLPGLIVCENCGSLKFPHKACGKCGVYSKKRS